MTRERLGEIIDDLIQINGRKARDCTDAECDLIIEFYYKPDNRRTAAMSWSDRHTSDCGLSDR